MRRNKDHIMSRPAILPRGTSHPKSCMSSGLVSSTRPRIAPSSAMLTAERGQAPNESGAASAQHCHLTIESFSLRRLVRSAVQCSIFSQGPLML